MGFSFAREGSPQQPGCDLLPTAWLIKIGWLKGTPFSNHHINFQARRRVSCFADSASLHWSNLRQATCERAPLMVRDLKCNAWFTGTWWLTMDNLRINWLIWLTIHHQSLLTSAYHHLPSLVIGPSYDCTLLSPGVTAAPFCERGWCAWSPHQRPELSETAVANAPTIGRPMDSIPTPYYVK